MADPDRSRSVSASSSEEELQMPLTSSRKRVRRKGTGKSVFQYPPSRLANVTPNESGIQKADQHRTSVPDSAAPPPDALSRLKGARPSYTKRSLSLYGEGDKQAEERLRLLANVQSTGVFGRRWYILVVVSLLAMLEGCIWNTWAPISGPAEFVFGWKDSDISLLANWGCIAYSISAFPLSWMMDTRGLRPSVITAAFLILAGAACRCCGVVLVSPGELSKWVINTGHILNGLSSPVTFGAPPLVSAIWFSSSQRTLATSIGTVASYAGIALSFVVGPLLVPEQCNSSAPMLPNCSTNDSGLSYSEDNTTDYQEFATYRIQVLLYGQCALAGILFLAAVIYFPSKPPLPPSLSGSGSRLDFVAGLKRLLRKRVFWVVAIVYGLTSGVYSGWSAVLNIILGNFGISQSHAGWIGFSSTVAGAIGGLAIARIADDYSGKLRQFLIGLFICSTLTFTWFAVTGLWEGNKGKASLVQTISFYASSILGGLFINSTIPLFFEMAVEAAFPISEGIAAVLIMLLNNAFTVIFLAILLIRDIGTTWTNWTLVGACALSIPTLAVLRDTYTRTALDATMVPPATPRPSRVSTSGDSVLRRSATMSPGGLLRSPNKRAESVEVIEENPDV